MAFPPSSIEAGDEVLTFWTTQLSTRSHQDGRVTPYFAMQGIGYYIFGATQFSTGSHQKDGPVTPYCAMQGVRFSIFFLATRLSPESHLKDSGINTCSKEPRGKLLIWATQFSLGSCRKDGGITQCIVKTKGKVNLQFYFFLSSFFFF